MPTPRNSPDSQESEPVAAVHSRDQNGNAWTLETLKEYLVSRIDSHSKLQDERDRLYMGKFGDGKIAVDDALKAQKELTNASFASSEKAIVKAEESQKSYNEGHNDLSRKMEVQYGLMMPRAEAVAEFRSILEKIDSAKTNSDERVAAMESNFNRILTEVRTGFEKRDDARGAEVNAVREQVTAMQGKTSGFNSAWAILASGVMIVVSLAGLYIALKPH
jgi:hypothetical protein